MKGKIHFAPIPKLPDNWWTDLPKNDPASVWTVWDKHNFYLWGANHSNYNVSPIGTWLSGGGLASNTGPTRGYSHPHYIGINTMETFYVKSDNDDAFKRMAAELTKGNNVVVPIYQEDKTIESYKYSLGTGIAAMGLSHKSDKDRADWTSIQKNILEHIIVLVGNDDSSLVIPNGVYWPDCRVDPIVKHPIANKIDIQNIIDNQLS